MRWLDRDLYWRLRGQLRHGHFIWSAQTLWWMAQELYHEWRFGVQTVMDYPSELDPTQECHHYQGMAYAQLLQILDEVAPRSRAEQEVFLDAGCCMGRALAAASRYPFERVSGFDYAPELVARARLNIGQIAARRRCGSIEVDWGDASQYEMADEVTLVLLFNPFRGTVMRAFMGQLRASFHRRPRRLRIVFGNPRHFDAAEYPWLGLLREWQHYNPYMGERTGFQMRTLLLEVQS